MHNLAIALQRGGHHVTGSDDEIYEPSRSRLESNGLLPQEIGWDPASITPEMDAVILGMHARPDNPELQRAIDLEIPVFSFPEFVAGQCQDKTRIVVAGSHGKTTTTSMIMHVLRTCDYDFDYLVGAQLPGFDLMVRLSDAPVVVIEGDEYLSSPVDQRPKFVHYDPHLLVITGIAWDHMNVFPTIENYIDQFRQLLVSLQPTASVFACGEDARLRQLVIEAGHEDGLYRAFAHRHTSHGAEAVVDDRSYPVQFFGRHNFENLQAAWLVCRELNVSLGAFLGAMQSFSGAAMRLDKLLERDDLIVYRDFAHAPSKVAATVAAVRARHPDQAITACLELHTFSSLNQAFMPQYLGTMDPADHAHVFYSPHTLQMKKLPPVAPEFVRECFGGAARIHTSMDRLIDALPLPLRGVHLWMSSGRFGGLDFGALYSGQEGG